MNGHENWTRNEGADENTNEMNGHENWTRNGKPHMNDYMDETEIIKLKKRRSNTERTMTPGGETHFLMQVPTVSRREHRTRGNAALPSGIAGREYSGHHLPVKPIIPLHEISPTKQPYPNSFS
jgi:hypothetical protein